MRRVVLSLSIQSVLALWVACSALLFGCADQRSVSGARERDADTQDAGTQIDAQVDARTDEDEDEDAAVTESDAPLASDAGEHADAGADAGPNAAIGPDGSVAPEPTSCIEATPPPELIGTAQEPYVYDASSGPLAGIVDWRSRAFIHVVGLTSGQRYAFMMLGIGLELALYPSTDEFTKSSCQRVDNGNPSYPPVCEATATDEPMALTLAGGGAPTEFQLHVFPVTVAAGTLTQPVRLYASEAPLEIVSPTSSHSFYDLRGLTAGEPYVLTARARAGEALPTDDFRIEVFSDPQHTELQDASWGPRAQVIAIPESTAVFLAIHSPLLGAEALLDVELAQHVSEGTWDEPVEVSRSALPHEGEVGWAYASGSGEYHDPSTTLTSSQYKLSGFSPGSYVVKARGPEGVTVHVSADDQSADPEHIACGVDLRDGLALCRAEVDDSVIHVTVSNSRGAGGPITLDVEPATYPQQGTRDAPLEIAHDELSGFEPALQHWQTGYYALTGLTHGRTYRFAHQVHSGGSFYLSAYGDAEWSDRLCPLSPYVPTQTCDIVAGSEALFVLARAYDGPIDRGFRFSLALEPVLDRGEGTLADPVRVDCASNAFEARIGGGTSYYAIDGVTPGEDYLIEVSGSERIELRVFPDGTRRAKGDGCEWRYSGEVTARCAVTSTSTSLYVELAGIAADDTLDVRFSHVTAPSEGTSDAPIAVPSGGSYVARVAVVKPSYYVLTGLEPGTEHVVEITPMQERVELRFASEHGISTPTWASPGYPRTFEIVPAASSEPLQVFPAPHNGVPTDVRIAVYPSPSP